MKNTRRELIALRNKCRDHYYYCKRHQEDEPDNFDDLDNAMYQEIVKHKIMAGYTTILGSEDWCYENNRQYCTPTERIEEVVTYLNEEIRFMHYNEMAQIIKYVVQERIDDDEMDTDLSLDDFLKEYYSSLSDTEISMIESILFLLS